MFVNKYFDLRINLWYVCYLVPRITDIYTIKKIRCAFAAKFEIKHRIHVDEAWYLHVWKSSLSQKILRIINGFLIRPENIFHRPAALLDTDY